MLFAAFVAIACVYGLQHTVSDQEADANDVNMTDFFQSRPGEGTGDILDSNEQFDDQLMAFEEELNEPIPIAQKPTASGKSDTSKPKSLKTKQVDTKILPKTGVAGSVPTNDPFCWPKVIPRDPPTRYLRCSSAKTRHGSFCFEECREPFTKIGTNCWDGLESYMPVFREGCVSNQTYSSGMCRSKCPPTTKPVGMACISKCPLQLPYKCGAGCAESKVECKKSIWRQVSAPIVFIENLVSLIAMAMGTGASTGYGALWPLAVAPVEMMTLASVKALMGGHFDHFSDLPKTISSEIIEQLVNAATAGKKIDWTQMDITGITQLVLIFKHPYCSNPEYESKLARQMNQKISIK